MQTYLPHPDYEASADRQAWLAWAKTTATELKASV